MSSRRDTIAALLADTEDLTRVMTGPFKGWVMASPRRLADVIDRALDQDEPTCKCPPCPGRGNDGHGLTHCAECCFGSGVEADEECPTHGALSLSRPDDRKPRQDEGSDREALVDLAYEFGMVVNADGMGDLYDFADAVLAWMRDQGFRRHPEELEGTVIDAAHIEHQRAWSTETFGPRDQRGPLGPLAHARKELDEVAAAPYDLEEWVDVLILALDGAWRAGHEPQQIIDGVKAKQAKNEARTWPDWRGVPADQAIEHVRTEVSDD